MRKGRKSGAEEEASRGALIGSTFQAQSSEEFQLLKCDTIIMSSGECSPHAHVHACTRARVSLLKAFLEFSLHWLLWVRLQLRLLKQHTLPPDTPPSSGWAVC